MEIEKLTLLEDNPRQITKENMERLKRDMQDDPGFLEKRPVLVNKQGEDYIVYAGNMRVRAAQELGWTEIPTIVDENLDEDVMRKRALRDNQEYGEWDKDILANSWDTELKELDLPELNFDEIVGFDIEEKDDIVPEDVPLVAKLGDLWALGRHRLLCGDATKIEDVERLMGGVSAKLIFTSPPYNMGGGMYETYEDNLKKEEYINFNINVLSNFQKYLKGFVFWNISYNKNARDSFIEIIYRILKETGLKFLELIVWNKKHAMPITSKVMMTRQYEDIFLLGDEENIQEELELFFCGRNDKRAYFNKKTNKGITNYWEIGTNKTQLENHLACYPVALPIKGIQTMTEKDDIVVDPFGGSGSTLIACEKTNRICYMMELDPKYCDVIIKRWEDYTGEKAKKL